ncbi:FMN-dependent NADH-azoreductase [Paenirhodobacter populi]|uniref:FMN dependent NADH:quinone oxidoreductase n=1 Tax=Paenirhodobacter populi TaxID=2306993 RepID=A0A443JI84_9RHOB|nr:NAD(P)H-dependent oxidoreductase [Sinirhodobacter populi]RWR20194.1 FMN-dependent NADH-azoreductase [Sinirhodobacter populi]
MTKILRIDTSIKGPYSVSKKLAEKITAKIGGDVTVRDATALPVIDGAWIAAAYTPAADRTPEQKAALALSDELIAELKAADVVVLGSGVYNFGVTGPLKTWIDQICRVGETFKYGENGPVGLVGNKRVIVAYASGGVPVGSAYDLATPYIRQVLGFIGITDITVVATQGVNVDEAAALANADAQIAALAA